MSSIGENIKKIRKMKKLTQEQLATRSGLSTMSIRRYESNERIPTLESVRKIASVLEVYMNELIVDWSEYSVDELGQDFGNDSDSSKNTDSKEEQIHDLFFLLNEKGQDKALEQVQLLTKIPEYQAKISKSKNIILALHDNSSIEELPKLNAAHARTDIDIPEGVDTSDDDIMDDENF